MQVVEMEKFGFAQGSTRHILVCTACHAEVEVGKTVPYKAKCPNGCGIAKTDHRFAMLKSRKPQVHRLVVISTTSKEYAVWQKMKKEK